MARPPSRRRGDLIDFLARELAELGIADGRLGETPALRGCETFRRGVAGEFTRRHRAADAGEQRHHPWASEALPDRGVRGRYWWVDRRSCAAGQRCCSAAMGAVRARIERRSRHDDDQRSRPPDPRICAAATKGRRTRARRADRCCGRRADRVRTGHRSCVARTKAVEGGDTVMTVPSHVLAHALCFEGPVYVYDLAVLRQRLARLEALPVRRKRIHFATMANDNPQVLGEIAAAGHGVFVNSARHLALALSAGFTPNRVIFASSNMTPAEMRHCHTCGVHLVLDSLAQVETFDSLASPGTAVGVRVNVGSAIDTPEIGNEPSYRFGLLPAELNAAVEARSEVADLRCAFIFRYRHHGPGDAGGGAAPARTRSGIIARSELCRQRRRSGCPGGPGRTRVRPENLWRAGGRRARRTRKQARPSDRACYRAGTMAGRPNRLVLRPGRRHQEASRSNLRRHQRERRPISATAGLSGPGSPCMRDHDRRASTRACRIVRSGSLVIRPIPATFSPAP
ncbi:hypothetical protein MCHK_8249 (plasmid) [Mesorhizobium huakuii 7653R]|nr:hypothetical protein MCHK_8249 [Mesorhizobium huakuii 7653R]